MYSTKEKPFFDILGRLGNLEGDVTQLKGDVTQLKGDMVDLKSDVKDIKKMQAMSTLMFIVSQIPVWITLSRQF